jgi:hypothetical protein
MRVVIQIVLSVLALAGFLAFVGLVLFADSIKEDREDEDRPYRR